MEILVTVVHMHYHCIYIPRECCEPMNIRLSRSGHRIEINQKSNSRENLAPFFQCTCPKMRHQYAILTPSLQVPPALLIFKRHLPVTKADVLLTSCTYIRKSWRSKLPEELARMEYLQRRMVTMTSTIVRRYCLEVTQQVLINMATV